MIRTGRPPHITGVIQGGDLMLQLLNSSRSLFSSLRDALTDSIEYTQAIDEPYAAYAGAQMHYYSSRCQAASTLLQDWMLWDSDIIFRSALECATRFIFVSTADHPERYDRIIEYTSFLSEVEDIERVEKLRTVVKNSTDDSTSMLMGGAALSKEREHELRALWPRTRRKILNQKWSFSEIVRVLEKIRHPTIDLTAYGSLLHSYSLSSHLIHADQTAMTLMHDRATREVSERKLLEEAHYARLAVQQTALLFICWRAIEHANGRGKTDTVITRRLKDLSEFENSFHERFAESQRYRYETVPTDQA